jgi:iron complex outermembrane receptor protein
MKPKTTTAMKQLRMPTNGKAATLFFILILITCTALAQSAARITGRVLEEGNNGLQGVTVSLLKATGSSLAKVTVTDKVGYYELDNLKAGTYLLSFTSVGFEKETTPLFDLSAAGDAPQPAIVLAPATQGLSGVTVQSRRPLVENKIDKWWSMLTPRPPMPVPTRLRYWRNRPGSV